MGGERIIKEANERCKELEVRKMMCWLSVVDVVGGCVTHLVRGEGASLQALVGPGGVVKTSGQHFPGGKERESGPLVRQQSSNTPHQTKKKLS